MCSKEFYNLLKKKATKKTFDAGKIKKSSEKGIPQQ